MNNIKIALVDDHQLFRMGMAAILNNTEGFEVVMEAENGHDLLSKLKSEPWPDVVLLDLEMPVMDGMQTMLELRKINKDARVILLTMHHDDRFVIHFMESGANGYLLKDSHPTEVQLAIKKVANGSYYFNDSVAEALLKGLKSKNKDLPALPGMGSLVEREVEVLKLICMEMSTPEIAEKLFLSPRTIEGYRKKLLAKIGAKNTAGLVLYAIRTGLITADK